MNPHEEKIRAILRSDARYDEAAYRFVLEALTFTVEQLGRRELTDQERHVSGRELLEGIREFSLAAFGPLAFEVFRRWGLHRCEDFGEIVFKLVDAGLLFRRESDQREDFSGGFDFHEAFVEKYAIELPGDVND